MTVPLDAVTADLEGNSIVWIYDKKSGEVTPKQITTSEMYDDRRIIVNGGLNGNEMVVTGGTYFLVEGMQIEPLTSSPANSQHTGGQKNAL